MANEPGFFTGVALGSLLGAGAAMIYGRRAELANWEQLRDRSLELRRQADEVSLRARDALEEMNQRSKLLMEEIRELFHEMAEEARQSAARTMLEIQSRLQERMSGAASRPEV